MKKSQEIQIRTLGGLLCMLIYPPIMGFAVAIAIYTEGMCFKSIFMLMLWLISLFYLWNLPWILQKMGRKVILHDERDIVISRNASLTAHAVSWLFFLSACLFVWWLVGTNGSVSVNVLPLIFVGGIVVYQIILVLSRLFQERIGRIHDE